MGSHAFCVSPQTVGLPGSWRGLHDEPFLQALSSMHEARHSPSRQEPVVQYGPSSALQAPPSATVPLRMHLSDCPVALVATAHW